MRATFALDLNLQPISVNAPIASPSVFAVGDVLWFAQDYTYENGGVVPAGTKVYVSHIDDDFGTHWLMAEGNIPALYHADNMLAMVPYDNDDLTSCLRAAIRCPVAELTPEQEPLPPSNVRELKWLKAVAVVAALAGLSAPSQLAHTRDQMRHSTQQTGSSELLKDAVFIFADATG